MEHALLVNTLLVGAVIVCAIAMRYGAEQNGLSPIVGYFVLGILLRATASFDLVPLLTEQQVFPFLADLGVIALIIMQRGLELGAWAVPPAIFAQVVLVSAVTVLVMPLALRPLLTPPSVLSVPESS